MRTTGRVYREGPRAGLEEEQRGLETGLAPVQERVVSLIAQEAKQSAPDLPPSKERKPSRARAGHCPAPAMPSPTRGRLGTTAQQAVVFTPPPQEIRPQGRGGSLDVREEGWEMKNAGWGSGLRETVGGAHATSR